MKAIRIPEPTSWRPDANHLFAFGVYRVPEDISEEFARRAVSDGAAVVVDDEAAEPQQPRRKKQSGA